MAKQVASVHDKGVLDSPPNLISPKNNLIPIMNVVDEQDQNQQLANEMADMIIGSMLEELKEEVPILVARPELIRPQPNIKFFEKPSFIENIHEITAVAIAYNCDLWL